MLISNYLIFKNNYDVPNFIMECFTMEPFLHPRVKYL